MWNTLMAEEGPTCARSGTRYPGVAKPSAVIIDVRTKVQFEHALR